jgi:hypothetical protein
MGYTRKRVNKVSVLFIRSFCALLCLHCEEGKKVQLLGRRSEEHVCALPHFSPSSVLIPRLGDAMDLKQGRIHVYPSTHR